MNTTNTQDPIREALEHARRVMQRGYYATIEERAAVDHAIAFHQSSMRPCGHPASLLLKSAETGEPLYCEACDDKSGRRDAEARESELLVANGELKAEIDRLKAALQPAATNTQYAINRAIQLCEWIAETPHQRGSINGLAAQVRHELSALQPAAASIEGYTAGDMATAAADGFRAGVASTQASEPSAPTLDVTKIIDAAVNKFLGWKLPKNFAPDSFISFDREKHDAWGGYPNSWPVGTNLFTAEQAKEMFEWCLRDALASAVAPARAVEPLTTNEIDELAIKHMQAFAQFTGAGEVWFEGELNFAHALIDAFCKKNGITTPAAKEQS